MSGGPGLDAVDYSDRLVPVVADLSGSPGDDGTEAEGDTIFPPLDPVTWQETSRQPYPQGSKDSAAFVLRVLDRKDVPIKS